MIRLGGYDMVFSSLTFLMLFLPLVLGLYFAKRSVRWRNGVLLIASLVFYAWGEPVWVLAMLLSSLVNYIAGRQIEKSADPAARKVWLIAGVSVSAGILFVFKYAAFLINSILGIFTSSLKIPVLELPIGISFYTFQAITYTVDVYRKKDKPMKSFPDLLLYISCFPQLIAGPIVQYGDIADRILARPHNVKRFTDGMQRFAVGLGKKVLLANLCGMILDELPLATNAASLSVTGAWYAALMYALQIYFDFSGYSDMAIGLGTVFGFDYKENFDHPYASLSVREFWRRWHISLGAFFRDYVYIPLGGNRMGLKRTVINTLIVWGLTGMWHGAAWSFILWGLYYGVILVLDSLYLKNIIKKVPAALNWLVTFALVLIGWVLFYYAKVGDAFTHIGAMFGIGASFTDSASVLIMKKYSFFPLIAFIASLPVAQKLPFLLQKTGLQRKHIDFLRVAVLSLMMVLSVLMLVGQSYNPFIYFQF